MSRTIRIDDDIYNSAKKIAKAECRTIAHQIEFWARVGKAALDNPDLPVDFIQEILIARAEDKEPFIPGSSDGKH